MSFNLINTFVCNESTSSKGFFSKHKGKLCLVLGVIVGSVGYYFIRRNKNKIKKNLLKAEHAMATTAESAIKKI